MNITALLDLAESRLRARPLRSWSDAEKQGVRLGFDALLRAWNAAWIPTGEFTAGEIEVHVAGPDGMSAAVPEDVAQWSFASESAAAASRASSSTLHAIASRMFAFDTAAIGPLHETPAVATRVAQAAWDDWLQRIDAVLGGFRVEQQEGAPASAGPRGTALQASPWSGALNVRWPWCGGTWHLALPHDAIAALLAGDAAPKRTPAPRTAMLPRLPLGQALGAQRLGVRVLLAGAELNLGQLRDLRLGDVIPLEQRLDAPVQVVTADGAPVCEGWLGRSNGRVAVELAPADTTHHTKENAR